MISEIVTILTSAGVSSLLAAALVFLTKSMLSERIKGAIKNEYDEKLASHKAQLKSQNDIELEHFKARLQIAASDKSIKLTQVFQKTVDTIEETYSSLLAFKDAVEKYVSIYEYDSDGTKEDRRKIVADKYSEFLTSYRPRKPFLPKSTVTKIDEFRTQLHKLAINFMFGVEKGGDVQKIQRGKEDPDTWMKANDFMTKEVPGVLEKLEDDLRRILGTYEEIQQGESGNDEAAPHRATS